MCPVLNLFEYFLLIVFTEINDAEHNPMESAGKGVSPLPKVKRGKHYEENPSITTDHCKD